MADADQQDKTSDQKTGSAELDALRSDVDNKLAQITEQLKAQNQLFAQGFAALQPKAPEQTIDETDVFDPRALRDKIMAEAERQTATILQEEQRKNITLANLAKDYPELNTDAKFQDTVAEALKTIPQSIRNTADGYELAVMKAVAKQGILPKSKRAETSTDDFSVSGSSGGGRAERGARGGKIKLDDRTLEVAKLLGRDTEDPEVIKRLEAAAKRGYNGYR